MIPLATQLLRDRLKALSRKFRGPDSKLLSCAQLGSVLAKLSLDPRNSVDSDIA